MRLERAKDFMRECIDENCEASITNNNIHMDTIFMHLHKTAIKIDEICGEVTTAGLLEPK